MAKTPIEKEASIIAHDLAHEHFEEASAKLLQESHELSIKDQENLVQGISDDLKKKHAPVQIDLDSFGGIYTSFKDGPNFTLVKSLSLGELSHDVLNLNNFPPVEKQIGAAELGKRIVKDLEHGKLTESTRAVIASQIQFRQAYGENGTSDLFLQGLNEFLSPSGLHVESAKAIDGTNEWEALITDGSGKNLDSVRYDINTGKEIKGPTKVVPKPESVIA